MNFYIEKQIEAERERQDKKFGDQSNNTLSQWMTILGEEFGEACQEVIEIEFSKKTNYEAYKRLETEMVQVAALSVAILEQLKKRRTCQYPGCPEPYTNKPPCALCYE